MQYTQRNPLPVPPGGAYEPLKATIDNVFDWQYALRKQNLLNLYEKGKTLAWNANDLDWSTDVDIEKLGVSYEVVPSLNRLLDDIILDARWDVTFLGMQIMVEGLALAAFGVTRMQLADEPLIQDLIGRVMADESRHVAFGVLSLSEL